MGMKNKEKAKKELNLEQKHNIAQKILYGESDRSIAQQFGVGKTTVNRIRHRLDEYINVSQDKVNNKNTRLSYKLESVKLHEDVADTIRRLRQKSIVVTKKVIQKTAIKEAQKLGMPSFKFSNNWFNRFKNLVGLKYRTLSGSGKYMIVWQLKIF